MRMCLEAGSSGEVIGTGEASAKRPAQSAIPEDAAASTTRYLNPTSEMRENLL